MAVGTIPDSGNTKLMFVLQVEQSRSRNLTKTKRLRTDSPSVSRLRQGAMPAVSQKNIDRERERSRACMRVYDPSNAKPIESDGRWKILSERGITAGRSFPQEIRNDHRKLMLFFAARALLAGACGQIAQTAKRGWSTDHATKLAR